MRFAHLSEVTQDLDLDLDAINHLAVPDSVRRFQAEQVQVALFHDADAQAAFRWQIQHCRDYGEPATRAVLEDQFPDVTVEVPQTHITDLIDRLRLRYLRTEGKAALQRITQMALTSPGEVPREMARASRALLDLTVMRGDVYGNRDVDRAIAEYHKQVMQGAGPSLGYPELDSHFFGQVGVTFIIGAPKTYKSWFVTNLLRTNIELGNGGYMFPLELPALETMWRLACMMANIPYWKYLKKRLTPDELDLVEYLRDELRESPEFTIDKPSQGQRSAAQLVTKAMDAGAHYIVIDQLQYVENRKGVSIGAMNSTADYFEVVNDLRNYSDEIPIIVVHQFNRSVLGAPSMPDMQQAKGSSAIEEVATLALGLWANKDMRHSNIVELGTLASRNYNIQAWNLGVELGAGCALKMLGPVEEEAP